MKPLGRIDAYELVGHLGSGGMGDVYEARHVGLDLPVALKLMRDEDPIRRERFRREGNALARLQHPGIVRVQSVGEHGGQPYLVMDRVEGTPLDRVVERGGALSPRRCAELGLDVARALAHVHEADVLHRDLKPANIIVTESGAPVLVDFGLAKLTDASQAVTKSGALLGTPSFMAPEQIRGTLDARTDVYGLGATLYALLTGRPPFDGETLAGLFSAILDRVPDPPSRAGAPTARLDALVLRCLEKDPEARYGSCAELADALELILEEWSEAGEPRSPAAWALAAVVLLLGVVLVSLLIARHETPGAEAIATPAPTASAPPKPAVAEQRAPPAPLLTTATSDPRPVIASADWDRALKRIRDQLLRLRSRVDQDWKLIKRPPWASTMAQAKIHAQAVTRLTGRLGSAQAPGAEGRVELNKALLGAIDAGIPGFRRALTPPEATALNAVVDLVLALDGRAALLAHPVWARLKSLHSTAASVGLRGRATPNDPTLWSAALGRGFTSGLGRRYLVPLARRMVEAAQPGDERTLCRILLLYGLTEPAETAPAEQNEAIELAGMILPRVRGNQPKLTLQQPWFAEVRLRFQHLEGEIGGLLGATLLRRGRWSEALSALNDAARALPASEKITANRARAYQFAGRSAEALALLKQALPARPDPWRNRFLIVAALELGRALGRPQQARLTLSLLNPRASPAGWWVQLAEAELGVDRPDALALARRALGVAIEGLRRQKQPGHAQKAGRILERLERTERDQRQALVRELVDRLDQTWFTQ